MNAEDIKPGMRVLVRRNYEPTVEGIVQDPALFAGRWACVKYVRTPGERPATWDVELDRVEPV